jgi:hypothetical protein
MNQNHVDALARVLSDVASRRCVLRGIAAAGPGLLAARRLEFAQAKKTRNPSSRKPKPNAFGCLNVDDACKRAGQCCSGRCEGKKGRRKCRAHDAGSCRAGAHPGECSGADVVCVTSLGKPGVCATTTGNVGYCLAFLVCTPCTTDAECQTTNGDVLGPRAACIRCAECAASDGTACAAPEVPQSMEAPARTDSSALQASKRRP